MLGTTAIATLVYFLLSLSLAMMVGIEIDSNGKAHVVYGDTLVDQCSPGSSGCNEISSFLKAAFSEVFWAAGESPQARMHQRWVRFLSFVGAVLQAWVQLHSVLWLGRRA